MPIKNDRVAAGLRGAQYATGGLRTVVYINSKRESFNAIVLGQGTTSGLKLRVPSLHTTIDNVAVATTRTSVNCYISR